MRRYTVTIRVARDATRRLDAAAHRRAIEAAVRRALPAGWTLAGARVSSRRVDPPTPDPVPEAVVATRDDRTMPVDVATTRDPLARIDRRLPQDAREWIAAVLRGAGCLRWRVETTNTTDRGRADHGSRLIAMPIAHRKPETWTRTVGGWDYSLVTQWLGKRGAMPARVNGARWLVLHEIAHALADRRLRSARRRWTKGLRHRENWVGATPAQAKPQRDQHGARFRRALLGLARRWAPEAFSGETAAAARPASGPEKA